MNITYLDNRSYYNAIHKWIGADVNLTKEIEDQFDEAMGVRYLPDIPYKVDNHANTVHHAHTIIDKDKWLLAKIKYGI